MKRICVIILAFALVLTAGIKGQAAATHGDWNPTKAAGLYAYAFSGAEESSAAAKVKTITSGDYEYQMNEDQKTITIVHYTGDDEKLEIPSEIDDHPVAGIGAEAFRYREFKSVSFPETIHSIEHQAFEYCVISDPFQLPENVIIHDDAFSYDM